MPSCLVLGDNIFYGEGLPKLLRNAVRDVADGMGCQLFGYKVSDPERYGVAEVDDDRRSLSIEEKPAKPKSNMRGHRPVLLRQRGRRDRREPSAVASWRVGDHRREPDLR